MKDFEEALFVQMTLGDDRAVQAHLRGRRTKIPSQDQRVTRS